MSIAIESKREYNRTRVNEGNTNDNGHECCDAHNGEDSGNVSFVSVSIAKATVMVVLNSSVKRYVCHRVTPRFSMPSCQTPTSKDRRDQCSTQSLDSVYKFPRDLDNIGC